MKIKKKSIKNIVVIGSHPKSLINFRGEFLNEIVRRGYSVTCMAGESDSIVINQLLDMGISFRPFTIQRNGINPLEDLKTLFSLRKALRDIDPDVVLAYTIKPIVWSGLSLKSIGNVQFYAFVTGLGYAFQNGGFFRKALTLLVRFLYRASLAKASRVIFQNPDNQNFFIKRQLVTVDRCNIVNGSGVNLDIFSEMPLTQSGVVFLTVGRLLCEKGFREFSRAARLVREDYPDVVFRLVGPTDPSPDGIPLEEVKNWELEGWIEYLGESKNVHQHLSQCHIFVLPSYHEGMPRTVLEAMATGRPILTTDVPGCRETVIPGENGWLVPKADADALAERMIWFIENRSEWQRMGQCSRKMAEERFDVHKVNRDLMEIMGLCDSDKDSI